METDGKHCKLTIQGQPGSEAIITQPRSQHWCSGVQVVGASESNRYELRPVPGGESITAGNPSLAAQIEANPPPSELQMHHSLSN